MLLAYLSLLETEEEKQKMTYIYEQYKLFCYHIAFQITHHREDADDAVHASFLEIIKNKVKYFVMPCSVLRASLVVIVKRKAIDILRAKNRISPDPFDLLEEILDESLEPMDDALSSQEQYNLMQEAMKLIPGHHQDILLMKYFEELSNGEIAEILHVSKKSVETKLYRAKLKLREAMISSGVTSNETDFK